jgi:23S rRNA (uracil1939-C5)-methyltransferase
MARSRRRRVPSEPVEARVESLTQDGRGVTHQDGKAVFIHGALPGERVRFTYDKVQRRYDEASVSAVLEPAADRVAPRCVHFGLCGGCSLQHLHPQSQIESKQQALRDALQRIGKVAPEHWLEPLAAEHWGYRRKARLGVKYVLKKAKLLVGFRERGSSLVADLQACEVLHPQVGQRIGALAELVSGLSIRDKVPQIEISMGDQRCALIFRVLAEPTAEDAQRLQAFAEQHGFVLYLQPGGADSVSLLWPQEPAAELFYTLPALGQRLSFLPQDFTQVNLELNRLMVERALAMLDPQASERLLDLFCGIGNFTLPLASRAGQVVGVEGEAGLVARARRNAATNGLDNIEFYTANLYDSLQHEPWLGQSFDKALLDPPRSGALEVLAHLPQLGVKRILYISCYPATLARDAGVLVNELGYQLRSAGVMDMFPHTAHVESIALFERV